MLSCPNVRRDIRRGEGRAAERQQCGGSDGDVKDLATGEVSGLGGRTWETCFVVGGLKEDKVDSRVGQPRLVIDVLYGCCCGLWVYGHTCSPLSYSSPFYFRAQGNVLNCYLISGYY